MFVYSIDMVRLADKAYLRNVLSKSTGKPYIWGLEDFMKSWEYSPGIRHWVGAKVQEYGYNFVFDGGGGSRVYLGYCHNSEKRSHKTRYALEFNPNKLNDVTLDFLRQFCRWFVDRDTVLIMFHLAIDLFGIPFESVVVDKARKHRFLYMEANNGRGYYVGQNGQDGFLRVYDKAKEQKVDGDWVRVEYFVRVDKSLGILETFDLSKLDDFPAVYILGSDNIFNVPLSAVDKALLHGLSVGLIRFDELNYRRRKKLQKLYFRRLMFDKKEVAQKLLSLRNLILNNFS